MKSLRNGSPEYLQIKRKLAKIRESFENMTEENYDENLKSVIEQCRDCLQAAASFDFRNLHRKINELLGLAYAERTEGDAETNLSSARGYLQDAGAYGKSASLKVMSEKPAVFAALCLQKIGERYNTEPGGESLNRYAAFANERALRHFKLAAQLLEEANKKKLLPQIHFQILNCYNRADAIRLIRGEAIPTRIEERILQAQKTRENFLSPGNTKELAEIETTLGNLFILRKRGNRYENRENAFNFWLSALKNESVKDDPEAAEMWQTMQIHFPEYARLAPAEQFQNQAQINQPSAESRDESNIGEDQIGLVKKLTSIHHYYLSFFPKIIGDYQISSHHQLWRDSWEDILQQSPQLKETAYFFAEFEKNFALGATEILDSFSVDELQACASGSENQCFLNFGKIARRKKPDFMYKHEAKLKNILDFLLSEPEKLKADILLEIEQHLIISAIYAFLANFADEQMSSGYKQSAREHFEIVMQNCWEQPFYSEGPISDLQLTLMFQRLYRLSPAESESPEMFQAFAEFNEGNLKIWIDAYEQEYQKSITEGGKHEILYRLSAGAFSIILQYAYALACRNKLVEAVLFLEKWRGRQFADSLQTSADELELIDETDRPDYISTIKKINSLKFEQRTPQSREQWLISEDLNNSYLALENIVKRIKSYAPEFLREPDFTELQKTASDKCPLLYLITSQQGTIIILVPREGMPRRLSIADFKQANLVSLIKKLKALNFGEFNHLLGEKLVKPLIDFLLEESVEGIHLIPCGALAVLPLHTTAAFESGCLIDHFDVYFTPTAYALSRIKEKLTAKRFETENFLAVSNSRGDLAFAHIETKVIASFFAPPCSGRIGEGKEATLEWLKTALSAARGTHIHFACHGRFVLESPLDSSISMAQGEELTLRAILNNNDYEVIGDARLVILSACETAVIDHLKLPEEFFGIASGFLQTGVSGVIGALWKVNDSSTAILMIKFYENLIIHRQSPATALRQAQIWLRQASSDDLADFYHKYPDLASKADLPANREAQYNNFTETYRDEQTIRYADPYYWAGFVLNGI